MLFYLKKYQVSTKQYVGDPIQCWVPGHFPRHYADYVNKICWVSNTYYLPVNDPVPMSTPETMLINYYQWVPMLLLFQAVTFYIPYLVWKNLSRSSGIDLHDLLETSKQLRDFEKRDKVLKHICQKIDHFLRYYQSEKKTCCVRCKLILRKCCMICGKRQGNYLGVVYILVKILYLGNAVLQVFLTSMYLSTDFHMLGINVVNAFLKNEESPAMLVFPRETFCDFKIRTKGSYHRYSVQCVLPINFFNEKIYVCIWFWFLFIIITTFISIIVWIFKIACIGRHTTIVRNYLQCNNRNKKVGGKYLKKFVHEYMRQDGVLLLRFLRFNISDLDVADLTGELWDQFQKNNITTHV